MTDLDRARIKALRDNDNEHGLTFASEEDIHWLCDLAESQHSRISELENAARDLRSAHQAMLRGLASGPGGAAFDDMHGRQRQALLALFDLVPEEQS